MGEAIVIMLTQLIIGFLAITAATLSENPSGDSGNCEPGWIELPGLGCLFFGNTPGTFEFANAFCQSMSSHLVEMLDESQMDYNVMELHVLDGILGPRKHWVGGTDLNREGQWYWLHPLSPVGSFVWHVNEPDGGLSQNFMGFAPELGYKCADLYAYEEW